MKTFDYIIKTLTPNQIFVFGSNSCGRHGKGAALIAKNKFGAIYGQGYGRQGNSYAIATKDLRVTANNSSRSISLGDIKSQIDEFIHYANNHLELDFFVTQFGTNLAGYTVAEIVSLFSNITIPDNVVMNKLYTEQLNYISDKFNYLHTIT